MTRAARSSFTLVSCVFVMAAVPSHPRTPAAGSARSAAAAGVACTLIPSAQLRGTLGLSQSMPERDDDNVAEAAGSPGDHNTLCELGVWDGPQPTSQEATLQLARSGHGAEVTIQTWTPNKGSPNANEWLKKNYHELTSQFQKGSAALPAEFSSHGLPTEHFDPPHFGHNAIGLKVNVAEGYAKGMVAAAGCWWDDKSSSAICLAVEESAARPAVKHLEDLAKVAVPKFLP